VERFWNNTRCGIYKIDSGLHSPKTSTFASLLHLTGAPQNPLDSIFLWRNMKDFRPCFAALAILVLFCLSLGAQEQHRPLLLVLDKPLPSW
jgi:hypothetical protein